MRHFDLGLLFLLCLCDAQEEGCAHFFVVFSGRSLVPSLPIALVLFLGGLFGLALLAFGAEAAFPFAAIPD
jgi:hypothetical protein